MSAYDVQDRPVVLPHELVDEMCAHLLAEKLREMGSIAPEFRSKLLPPVRIKLHGFGKLAQTKEDFQILLAPWKRELGRLMLKAPRKEEHSIPGYYTHLSRAGAGDNWYRRFEDMKVWLAHIARIEDEEREEHRRAEAQRKREEQERAERQRDERKALERQATIDEREVNRLLAVIAEAREIEELMAILERAKDARHALLGMYTNEREACVALGRPVPERSIPGWPNALDPPTVIRKPIAMNGEGRRATSTHNGPGVTHG